MPLIDELAKLDREDLDCSFAEALESAILQSAISGQLTIQHPEDGNATELLERIATEREQLTKEGKLKRQKSVGPIEEDEKPFDIPGSWRWKRFAEIVSINPPVYGRDDDQVAFLPMASIADGYSGDIEPDYRLWKEVKSGYAKFAQGDIVVAKITPCFQNRKSAIIKDMASEIGAGTTEIHVCRPSALFNSEYALYVIKSEYVIASLIPKMTGTAGQKRIPVQAISKVPFPVPPVAEQKRIVQKLGEMMPILYELKHSLTA